MTSISDEQLILQIQAGDIPAYELLVKKYQKIILNFVSRYVKEHAAAEEITQDTFYKVYTYIDKIDVNKQFTSFLFQVAKNKALDYLRTRKIVVNIDDLEIIDEEQNPEHHLDQEIIRNNIRTVLDKLPTKYKEVIKLYYFDELSYQEISAKIRLPINTVRTNLRRAKLYLKKELNHE